MIFFLYQKVIVFLSKIDVFGEKASRRKPQAGSSLGGWMQPASCQPAGSQVVQAGRQLSKKVWGEAESSTELDVSL